MGRAFERRKYSIFKTAAQNSKLYAKYSKQVYVAAKNGVPDPAANPHLRLVVEKAKKENVPSHVIDKAIQKAAGKGGEDFVVLGAVVIGILQRRPVERGATIAGHHQYQRRGWRDWNGRQRCAGHQECG